MYERYNRIALGQLFLPLAIDRISAGIFPGLQVSGIFFSLSLSVGPDSSAFIFFYIVDSGPLKKKYIVGENWVN